MKKLMLALIIGTFFLSFAIAQQNGQLVGNDSDEHGCKASAGYSYCQNLDRCIRSWETNCSDNESEENQEQNQIQNKGEETQIKKQEESKIKLKAGNISVESELEIENETSNNKTQFKVKMSNGRNAEIKIMPETASERAIQVLQSKFCNGTNNCTIELKEVGNGNKTRLAYEFNVQEEGKVLFLFKKGYVAKAQVDAETGEIVVVKKPWWAFLATKSD